MPCHTSQTSHRYAETALSFLSTALTVDASPPTECGKLCLNTLGPELHLHHSTTLSKIVLFLSGNIHSALLHDHLLHHHLVSIAELHDEEG